MQKIIFRVVYRCKTIFRTVILWCCLSIYLLQALGQNSYMYHPDNGKASFGLSVLGAVYSKTHISPSGGQYRLGGNPQLGYELILHYNYLFEKNFLLSFGMGGNLVAYNFNYDIEKDFFDPPTESNISSNKAASRYADLFSFKLEAEVQHKIQTGARQGLSIGAGLSLLFAPAKDESISEYVFYPSGSTRYFLHRTQTIINRKPWINFQATLGYDWQLLNGQFLGVFTKINYSPVHFISGTYEVDPGNSSPALGEYFLTGTFIGAGINFTLKPR
jgi:hypothetical protein